MKSKPSERGAALLMTLLLVAVMAAVAVAVLDDIRFAIRRTSNMETLAQAQWYALGAETLAKARLKPVLARQNGEITLEGGWSGLPFTYPIDNGSIQLRLSDRGACFNVNSVVTGEPGQYVANRTAMAQFRQLLDGLEIPEGEAAKATDALTDWIDSDSAPEPFGAEDDAYTRRQPARLTAAGLLTEESELRAIEGFTPELYNRVRPFVCALPIPQLTDLNINTLRPEDAPILSAVFLGRLSVGTARRIIADRPSGGWPNHDAFLQEPAMKETTRSGGAPPVQQLVVRSRFFALEGQVHYDDIVLPYSALLEAHPSGVLMPTARRWTLAE